MISRKLWRVTITRNGLNQMTFSSSQDYKIGQERRCFCVRSFGKGNSMAIEMPKCMLDTCEHSAMSSLLVRGHSFSIVSSDVENL